jgi:serine/threonine protein kinase
MISFACPSCKKKLAAKDELAGRKTKCPGCGQPAAIPAKVTAGSSPTIKPAPQPTIDQRDPPTSPSLSNPDPTLTHGVADEAPNLTSFLSPPQSDDELGRLGKYRILKVLGHGGMGVVYRAEDPVLERVVAIKAMLPSMGASKTAAQRFLREARMMAKFEHDHIVRVYDAGEDHGVTFLAMEFLKGESLDQRLHREKTVPLAEALRIGREMAEGLAAAHAHGMIHRDIKPGNLWIEAPRGRVKILDFGLARAVAENAHLTQSGVIVGTPAFMAPEQARGEDVDGRCDLFSVGVVLYRLVTGVQPFKGKDTMSTLMSLALESPPPPAQLSAQVPAELSDLIMRLIEKDRERRIGTADEVATILRTLERRFAPAEAPATPAGTQVRPKATTGIRPPGDRTSVSPMPPRAKRRIPMAIGLAVLVTAAALPFVLGFVFMRPAPPIETRAVVEKTTTDNVAPPLVPKVVAVVDKAKPFVLRRAGKMAGEYKTFAAMWADHAANDTIEVHGDGPFLIGAIETDGPLTIVAGAGYRPQFQPSENVTAAQWINVSKGPARFEGCDFYASRTDLSMMKLSGACEFSRCRLVKMASHNDAMLFVADAHVRFVDSMLIGGFAHATVSILGTSELEMENCLFYNESYSFFAFNMDGGKKSLRLKRNTFVGGGMVATIAEQADAPVELTAEGNVFASAWRESQLLATLIGASLKKSLHWKGVDNAFAAVREYDFARGAEIKAVAKLADWSQIWGKDDRGSREIRGLPVAFQAIWASSCEEGVQSVRRSIEARRPASLPDVGPSDFDIIGPGAAYVKALEKRLGRKLTEDELRPEAVEGGPATLIRAGKVLGGFPDVPAAAAAAENGDVIELRTDHDLPWFSRTGPNEKSLTLRAGPGYRPSVEWLVLAANDVWTIEGIRFRVFLNMTAGEAGQMRLVNCSLDPSPADTSTNVRMNLAGRGKGERVEIENCCLPAQSNSRSASSTPSSAPWRTPFRTPG